MADVRYDELTGMHALLAPGRAAAVPIDRWSGLPVITGRCPFCPGNEDDTEVTIDQRPSTGPWRIRVVRNRYPIVAAEHHEVLVEAREHDADLPDFTAEHLREVMRAYRDRAAALAAMEGVAAVALFRNRGRRAGSSQPHPHSQLVALPVVPIEAERRTDRDRAHRAEHGEPLLDAVVRRELEDGVRVVQASSRFVAHVPYAPRFSHEIRIAPRTEVASFGALDDAAIDELADVLGNTSRRLRVVTAGADWNLIIRQPGVGRSGPTYLELLPRRSVGAGFELTTGMSILLVTPEDSAAALRAAPFSGPASRAGL